MKCFAYDDNGKICGKPATQINRAAGMAVCDEHAKFAGLKFDLEGLKEAFRLGRGIAGGQTINVMAACSPATLEAEGWIEKVVLGRWGQDYKPSQKLIETK